MATVLQPWQILVVAMAGWITRQQDAVIDYLREENRVLTSCAARPERLFVNRLRSAQWTTLFLR